MLGLQAGQQLDGPSVSSSWLVVTSSVWTGLCIVLSFSCVQVGGGPTGVELAAEIHDMIAEDMSSYFPNLKARPAALAPASVVRLQGQADGTCSGPRHSARHTSTAPPACVGRCSS